MARRIWIGSVARWLGILFVAMSSAAFSIVTTAEDSPQLPILLVYGFQPLAGFRTTQIWEEFAEHLSGNDILNTQVIRVSDDHEFYYLAASADHHRDVFMSNFAMPFEPTGRDIFFYTKRLANEIDFMKEEFGVQKLDVVGHSVGGLIARTYAEIGDFAAAIGTEDFKDYNIAYGGEIRTLIMLATPNHGTVIATLGELFSTLSRQLSPGSQFLKLLNVEHWIDGRLDSLNPSVRYVSMAGQTCLGCGLRIDQESCLQSCIAEGLSWNGSDLVIMMVSAYLPEAENCALIGFDHVRIHTETTIVAAIRSVLEGGQLPSAVYASELLEYKLE